MLVPAMLSRMAVLCKFTYESFRGAEILFSEATAAIAPIAASGYWRLGGLAIGNLLAVNDRVLMQVKSLHGCVDEQRESHSRALAQMRRLEVMNIWLEHNNWTRFLEIASVDSLRMLTLLWVKVGQDMNFQSLQRLTHLELMFQTVHSYHIWFPENLSHLTLETWWLYEPQSVFYEQLPVTIEQLELRQMRLDSVDVLSHLTKLEVLRLSNCRITSSTTTSVRMWTDLKEFSCRTVRDFSEWPFGIPRCSLLDSMTWHGPIESFGQQTTLPVIRTLDITVRVFTPALEVKLCSFVTLKCLRLREIKEPRLSSLQLNDIFKELPKLESCSVGLAETIHGTLPTLTSTTLMFLDLRVLPSTPDRHDSTVHFGCFDMPELRRLRLFNWLCDARNGQTRYRLARATRESRLPNLRQLSCRWFGDPHESLLKQLARLPQKPDYHVLRADVE